MTCRRCFALGVLGSKGLLAVVKPVEGFNMEVFRRLVVVLFCKKDVTEECRGLQAVDVTLGSEVPRPAIRA
jgi:hypothetical protein